MFNVNLQWYAGVYLMLWNPSRTPAASEAGSQKDSQLEFSEAAKKACLSTSSSIDTTVIIHHGLMLSSCRRFTNRWLLNAAAAQDEVRLATFCIVQGNFVLYEAILHTMLLVWTLLSKKCQGLCTLFWQFQSWNALRLIMNGSWEFSWSI